MNPSSPCDVIIVRLLFMVAFDSSSFLHLVFGIISFSVPIAIVLNSNRKSKNLKMNDKKYTNARGDSNLMFLFNRDWVGTINKSFYNNVSDLTFGKRQHSSAKAGTQTAHGGALCDF